MNDSLPIWLFVINFACRSTALLLTAKCPFNEIRLSQQLRPYITEFSEIQHAIVFHHIGNLRKAVRGGVLKVVDDFSIGA